VSTVLDDTGTSFLVVAPPDSAVFAVINTCPHQGAELLAGFVGATDGRPWIECPLHSWRFDLVTGRHLIRGEPSEDPRDCLNTVPCDVDDAGVVWLTST
jgi:nitrite reductase/ring-hydroxylating ferredoxin subunit